MKKYSDAFEWKERPNGSKFCCVKHSYYELRYLVADIHYKHFFHCLPNDWIWLTVYTAFVDLEGIENEDEYENFCSSIDDYFCKYKLIMWLQEPYAEQLVNEELEHVECPKNLRALIANAQIKAKGNIYASVWGFMQIAKRSDNVETTAQI